jgi:HlyD family secretion protein
MRILQKWIKQYAGLFPEKLKFLSWLIPAVIALLVIIIIGISVKKPAQQETSAQLQKSVVSRGEILIAATGTGELVTTDEVSLSFPVSGEVTDVYVAYGDDVVIGDLLAKQENTTALEADVATNQLSVLNAQKAIEDLQLNAELTLLQAKSDWIKAQQTYDDAKEAYDKINSTRCTTEVIAKYQTQIDRDEERMSNMDVGSDEWLGVKTEYDTAIANRDYCSGYTEMEKQDMEANYQIAEIDLATKEERYNLLDDNDGVDPDELTLLQAELDNAKIQLESAQEKLDNMTLEAPIDGTVSELNGEVGDIVSTDTFITIVNMEPLTIVANIDESDLDIVAVGEKATVVFDSFPNITLTGVVTLINPQLQTLDQYNVVELTIEIDSSEPLAGKILPIGLSATVEVIKDSVPDALMVPVEALYALDDKGSYGVLLDDGTDEGTMTPVTLGITNGTFIEILSGLEEGDVVYVDWFNYQYQSES